MKPERINKELSFVEDMIEEGSIISPLQVVSYLRGVFGVDSEEVKK